MRPIWSVLLLTAASVTLGTVSPAGASAPGACASTSGVTVVVDFTALGGSVVVRCSDDQPSDGWEALRSAGFEVRDTVPAQGFVCRIDQLPTTETCIGTPPPDAYWSYWHASRGGTWTYSDFGARNRVPQPGSVEGWAFATGTARPPSIPVPPPTVPPTVPVADTLPGGPPDPAGLPAPPPGAGSSANPRGDPSVTVAGRTVTPAPSPRPPTASPTPSPPVSTAVGGDAAGPLDPQASDSTPPAPSSATAEPRRALEAPPGDRRSAPPTESASVATIEEDEPSGPGGTILGVAAVAALGGAALVIRRRRAPSAE